MRLSDRLELAHGADLVISPCRGSPGDTARTEFKFVTQPQSHPRLSSHDLDPPIELGNATPYPLWN